MLWKPTCHGKVLWKQLTETSERLVSRRLGYIGQRAGSCGLARGLAIGHLVPRAESGIVRLAYKEMQERCIAMLGARAMLLLVVSVGTLGYLFIDAENLAGARRDPAVTLYDIDIGR